MSDNDRGISVREEPPDHTPPILLDLGCGPVRSRYWIGVDGSNRAWLASKLPYLDQFLVKLRVLPPTEFDSETKYANLTKTFPWQSGYADAIHMGEVLEHFSCEQGEAVLKECFRVLKSEGILRICVPDNAHFWENYLAKYHEILQKPRPHWDVGHTRWIEMFFHDVCISRPKFGRSMGHYHKWAYDEVSLILALEGAGFSDVHRMEFHESRIPHIEDVEVTDFLIVEGRKP